jgi:hypothetical protein
MSLVINPEDSGLCSFVVKTDIVIGKKDIVLHIIFIVIQYVFIIHDNPIP